MKVKCTLLFTSSNLDSAKNDFFTSGINICDQITMINDRKNNISLLRQYSMMIRARYFQMVGQG